ncbi:hypothetical protein JB92DRAFT_2808791 [Gautieria morchelliformis]|nr:hypothetical protein JB92DRAFT_2808791 [Gautieria morchelliformis]
MAEALAGLAVAASVIAVVQITEDVITKCSAYRVTYKNASKDMIGLSDQVSGLRGVLLDLHKLIVAEEAQTFSRLPTLMTALDISHGDQKTGGTPEVTKSEDDARPGYGLIEPMPNERTSLLKRLLKSSKRKGGKNMIDTQCEQPDGIPSPTATGSSLTAEGGNTAWNASESKNDRKSLPRVLRDCHDELHSLSKKLETKNVRTSRKEALVYAIKQGEVNKTLDRLRRFQQQIVVALSIDQIRLALEADDNQRRQDIYQCRQDVYKWLAAPDYESKHLNAAGEWEKGTGSWFLRGESFHEWKTQPKSFLWLHGKGISTIIRAISGHSKSNPSIAVAFFYFDFRNKDIEPHSLLRALIKQLSLKSTHTFNYVAKLFSDKNNGQEWPSLEELKSTLEFIIGTFEKNVYIIFDALDECPRRHQFLELIKEIHEWKLDALHLLATSRDEQDIEKTLRVLVSHQVSMDEGLVDSDIRVYVSRKLKDDNKLSEYSGEKKETIQTTLIAGAHGMFRWVVCQLDALRKCRSPYELRKALTNLPKTLYETYDRILLDIEESNRDYALKLLQWLAFSADTVSLSEAVEVLATDPNAKTGPLFDPERRFDDPWDILTLCSSLVSVTTVTDNALRYHEYLKDGQGQFTELRLAHFSVREYLVSECLRTHCKLSIYHCDEKLANTFIAKTCVAYLLQFNQHSISRDIWISHPLCSYAAEYWIRHTQPDNDDDSTLRRLIMGLLQPESAVYSNWLKLCNPDSYSRKCAPIYYMSEAGLAIISQDLLENGADINAQGRRYGNALQIASLSSRHPMIQLLLEKGADVNAQGGQYGNALQAASLSCHLPTVELLLQNGADVNAQQGGQYGNALRRH